MKRFHVHIGVSDLEQSIRFYSCLFGTEPAVRKDDYAKWMIDDPRINFAISARDGNVGVNHLGLQADSASELAGIREHFAAADQASLQDQPDASCCYARSDKHWVTDPQGIAWEGYHTLDSIRYFDGDTPREATNASTGCCAIDGAPAEMAATSSGASSSSPPQASGSACCAPAAAADTACCTPMRAKSAGDKTTRCCR